MTTTTIPALPLPGVVSQNDLLAVSPPNLGTDTYKLSIAQLAANLPLDVAGFTVGSMFFTGNATATTGTGTPVQINATYQSGILEGFTQASGVLTYIDAFTRTAVVNCSMTISDNLTGSTVKAILYQNGSPVTSSEQEVDLVGVSPDFQSVSLTTAVTLTQNDEFEVRIQETSGNPITVQDFNTTIYSLGGALTSAGFTRQLGSCLIANGAYTQGVWSSMIDTFSGTQAILPNSLPIGGTVEITANLDIDPSLIGTQPTLGGSLRYIFGSTTIAPPGGTNQIIVSNNSQRSGELKYTISRNDASSVDISLMGSYTKTDITYTSLYPDYQTYGSGNYFYDPLQTYFLDIEYLPLVGSVTEFLVVTVRNLRIVQY